MSERQPTISSQMEQGERERQRKPRRLPLPWFARVLLVLTFIQAACSCSLMNVMVTLFYSTVAGTLALISPEPLPVNPSQSTLVNWFFLGEILVLVVSVLWVFLLYKLYEDWQEYYIQMHEEAHLRAIHNRWWKFPR